MRPANLYPTPSQFYTTLKYLLIVINTLFFLSACTNQKQQDQIFRLNIDTSVSSLDPAFAKDQANIWAVTQVYEGLVQLDENLKVRPCVAKSWSISPNGKKLSFSLRNDVYFHPNACFDKGKRKVVANDFVFSFERILDPKTASPGSWVFNHIVNEYNPFVAVNDSVFEIHLKKPFPPLLGILSMPYCFVVPKEAVSFYGNNFRNNPVGSGPFYFAHWTEGVSLALKKNILYFDKDSTGKSLPHLAGVEIKFSSNKESAMLEFFQGKLDFVNGVDGTFKNEILSKNEGLNEKYANRFNLVKFPYLNTEYLGFNQTAINKNPKLKALKNVNVRKALSFAIDREKMLKYLRNNLGVSAVNGFVPLGLPGNRKRDSAVYNLIKAKASLAEAGYPNGAGFPELTLYTNPGYLDISIFIQNQWKQLGIKSKLEVNSGSFHRQMVANAELPIFRGSWLADYPDAENYLSLFYTANFSPAGPNYFHYANDGFDSLYDKALRLTDTEEIIRTYQIMDEIITKDCPVVVLFYDQAINLLSKRVQNFKANAMNIPKLKYCEIK